MTEPHPNVKVVQKRTQDEEYPPTVYEQIYNKGFDRGYIKGGLAGRAAGHERGWLKGFDEGMKRGTQHSQEQILHYLSARGFECLSSGKGPATHMGLHYG